MLEKMAFRSTAYDLSKYRQLTFAAEGSHFTLIDSWDEKAVL